jgi:hypothetical protein
MGFILIPRIFVHFHFRDNSFIVLHILTYATIFLSQCLCRLVYLVDGASNTNLNTDLHRYDLMID